MSNARQSITLDEVWEKSLNDIEYLFQFQTLRYSKWMLLYTHIFDYCTNNKHFNGADLYEKFRNYLRNYVENLCQSISNLQDQNILEFYINQSKKYRISSKILHGICSYFHRNYVKREHDSGNPDICEIYSMAMQIWQQVVSRLSYRQITQICLNMIKAERNHEKIDTEIISKVIQTYVTIEINEHVRSLDNNNQMLDFYQEYFEEQFLQDTQDFYRLEATTYLQQHSVLEYLLKISQYFDEEIHRVKTYLHPSTFKKLVKKLEEVLIHDQLIVINAEAKILIHDEKIQELNLLFKTVNQIENGKIELKNILENHIYQIGIETIERINPISTNDLKIYIQTIYDLHNKYSIFIQKAFDSDQELIDVLDRAFRKLVNDNAVIQTVGNMTIMAEHLARNCDKFLRKGRREEIDLELIFDQIKIVLYYIQEKDVFGKFYSKLLAKRLVNQISISNDYEKLMISNIQNACGFEYVYKMKQMCQDIETSKTILDQYYKTEQFDTKIIFNMLILNSNAWLFSIPLNIILPNKLQLIFKNFNQFYNHFYNGRKLIWLHQHSKGELQTFFTDKIYTLQVSMYQMMILLLFNNSSELTIEKIHDQTEIKIDLLLQILNSLLKSKILLCTQFIDQINLDMNCTIKLSNDFISEKYCINLNIPMKSIEENDAEIFHKKIDQDRIMVTQAAIIRIMKLHKIMNQNLLIQTVIEQLNSHFNPNVSSIKDCINILIKKEYLERQSNNKDLLCYMS